LIVLLNNLSEIEFKIDIPDTDTYDEDTINEDKNIIIEIMMRKILDQIRKINLKGIGLL